MTRWSALALSATFALLACASDPQTGGNGEGDAGSAGSVASQGGQSGGAGAPVSGNSGAGAGGAQPMAGASAGASAGGQGGSAPIAGSAAGAAGGTAGTTMQPPGAPPGSPVAQWGQLKVCGSKICNAAGAPVQLKGVSSMWLNWESTGYAANRDAVQWMRDNWNVKVIRAAMGIEPAGAYLSDATRSKNTVQSVIDVAIDVGIYVIVDWHDHNAQNHQQQATAFFAEMAAKYADKPNVLWETFNEPLQVSWSGVLKPYHQAVVSAIRAKDPDNIIILGTPQWSQRVDEAANDPLAGTNLMYTLHFYSCSHTGTVRGYGMTAASKGLPIFVTEWGATNADGGLDGQVCLDEAQRWHDWMNGAGIGWTAWKLDDCNPDSSCLLKPGAPVNGNWTDQWLHGHATFVRSKLM